MKTRYSARSSVRTIGRLASWGLGGLCLAARLGFAEQTLVVYPLGQTEASVAAEVIRPLLSTNDQIIVDARAARLLVRAEGATQAQIAQIMKTLAVPVQNVRIDVEFDDQAQTRESGFGVSGRGQVNWPLSGGSPSGGAVVTVKGVNRTETQSHETVQSLLVASGREASLRVGESVPNIDWFMEYGRYHGVLKGQVTWQDVGSFLVVQPTVIGSGPDIRIRIIPELSGTVEGQPHRIRFASAATEVTVRAGETVSIGGLQQDDTFYSRFLFGYEKGGGTRALDIRLTPTLSSPDSLRGPVLMQKME